MTQTVDQNEARQLLVQKLHNIRAQFARIDRNHPRAREDRAELRNDVQMIERQLANLDRQERAQNANIFSPTFDPQSLEPARAAAAAEDLHAPVQMEADDEDESGADEGITFESPVFEPEPSETQPLPPQNRPEPNPGQTRDTSGPDASENRAEPGPDADRKRDASEVFQATADPRSNLDSLPIEDQDLIYDTLQKHGIRPSIPILARPRERGGLAQTFARSTLERFLNRFRARRSKTHRLLARDACLEQIGRVGPETTGVHFANAHLTARLIDMAFEPDLPDTAMSRVIMDLNRLRQAGPPPKGIPVAELRKNPKPAAPANNA